MSREYRHVKGYEEKIIELKEKGLTEKRYHFFGDTVFSHHIELLSKKS